MYIRNSDLTLPLLVLSSVAIVVIADSPLGGYHSPQPSYALPDDQVQPSAGVYVYEEEYPSGRIVRSISNQLKKWVSGNPIDRKGSGSYAAPSTAETVNVKIPACNPVTEYVTTRITQNVAVRTHCMRKSIYRNPNKIGLMHQSSKCSGYLCNPQLQFDPYNPQTTSLQLPISPNPLTAIFSNIENDSDFDQDYSLSDSIPRNIDYDYNPSIEPEFLSVENLDVPDYVDTVKGVLLHVDRNFDFSDPNFGLPPHLFISDSQPKQLDYTTSSFEDNLNQVYAAPTDDYNIDYEYDTPLDNDNFRSSLSDYDSLEDSIPIHAPPLSNTPRAIFSNVSFHSPKYYLHYSPNYVIPPNSEGLDLSHSLRFKIPGSNNLDVGIPLPVMKNANRDQGTISILNAENPIPNNGVNVGIPIPNNDINVGTGLPQDVGIGLPQDVGIGLPQDMGIGLPQDVGIGLPQDVGIGLPQDVGIGLPQDSIPAIDSQIGFRNPASDVGIPIPNAENPVPNNDGNVGIPIPNNNINVGFGLPQGSTAPTDSQIGFRNHASDVGIPLPNTEKLIPNNGVSVGIPIPNNVMNVDISPNQDSIAPINSQIGLDNPNLSVGIPIPNAENPISNNVPNLGTSIPNKGTEIGISLPQDSTIPIGSQIGIHTSGLDVGIPIPNTQNSNPNSAINVGTPILNIDMNKGNSQIGINNPELGVGIPIPKSENPIPNNGPIVILHENMNVGISLPQDSSVPADSQNILNHSGLDVGIPIPNPDISVPNNGVSANIPIPNNGISVGIPLPQDTTVPTNSQIGFRNHASDVGISIPNAENSAPNNGPIVILEENMNVGIPLPQDSSVPADSQNIINHSGLDVGIPIPNTDISVPNTGGINNPNLGVGIPIPNAENSAPNNGVNVGIPLPQDSAVQADSNRNLNNFDVQVGIPLPGARNNLIRNNYNYRPHSRVTAEIVKLELAPVSFDFSKPSSLSNPSTSYAFPKRNRYMKISDI